MLSKNKPMAIYDADLTSAMRLTLQKVDEALGLVDKRSRGILAAKIDGAIEGSNGVATVALNKSGGDDILSEDLNNLMISVYFDLHHLFKRLKRSRNIRRGRETVKRSSLSSSNDYYVKLKHKIKKMESHIKYPIFDKAHHISFPYNANQSTSKNQAEISNGRLQLQKRNSLNVGAGKSIELTQISGGSYSNISSHPLSHAIDPDPNTYWSQITTSQSKLPAIDIDLGDGKTYYEETGNYIYGSACHLDILIPKPQAINQIKILPFCDYPIKIVDIAYREADNDDLKQIPMFDSRLASPNKDYVVFQFATIYAKSIRITIAQESYSEILHLEDKNDIIIKYNQSDTDTQDKILEQALSSAKNAILSINNIDPEKVADDAMFAIAQAIEQINPKSAKRIYSATEKIIKDEPIQNKGYAYKMGISDIQILQTDFANASEFTSESFDSNGIFRVQIITDEEHPVLYDKLGELHRSTSIRWKLDIGNGRTINILPANSVDNDNNPIVFDEQLITTSGNAKTRWTIDTSKFYNIRANGSSAQKFNINSDGTQVNIIDYNPDLIYTISYYPLIDATNNDPSDILIEDYAAPVVNPEEVFDGNDKNSQIKLTYHPHIALSVINDITNFWRPDNNEGIWNLKGENGKVLAIENSDVTQSPVLTNSANIGVTHTLLKINGKKWGNIEEYFQRYEPIQILIDGEIARNMTDYLTGEKPSLMDQKTGSGIRYYIQNGNTIEFDGPIEGQIRVRYESLVANMRLCATLNCNRSFPRDLTPMVKNATIMVSENN